MSLNYLSIFLHVLAYDCYFISCIAGFSFVSLVFVIVKCPTDFPGLFIRFLFCFSSDVRCTPFNSFLFSQLLFFSCHLQLSVLLSSPSLFSNGVLLDWVIGLVFVCERVEKHQKVHTYSRLIVFFFSYTLNRGWIRATESSVFPSPSPCALSTSHYEKEGSISFLQIKVSIVGVLCF